jgi:hypothetical protein
MLKSAGIGVAIVGMLLLTYGAMKLARSTDQTIVSGTPEFSVEGVASPQDQRQFGQEIVAVGGLLGTAGLVTVAFAVSAGKRKRLRG